MNTTPLTDAFEQRDHVAIDAMWGDFARTLERELADRPTDVEFEAVCTSKHSLENEVAKLRHDIAGLRGDLEMVRGHGADIARRFAEHRESTSRYQAELRAERDAARAELARAQEIIGIGDVLKR